jgi:DNA-directed RNA polymerase II subunit RPB2
MLADKKTMDVPRHVLQTLFSDTKFPLIQHHADSFNDFLDVSIPTFIRVTNATDPFELHLAGTGDRRRYVRVYIGTKDGSKLRYASPVEDDGTVIVPHACRLDNRTYALSLFADIEVEYTFEDGSTESRTFPDVMIGKIPLMLRSRFCYLTALPNYEIGECKYELGGYFIIGGAEKVLLTQELLGANMFAAGTRKRKAPQGTKTMLVESDEPITFEDVKGDEGDGVSYEEVTETYVSIKTLSEDGARGPYSHFLTIPAPTLNAAGTGENYGRDNRVAMINIRGFAQPVPLFSIFRALGCTSDRDIYDTVLAGVPDKDRTSYDDTLYQLLLSHDKFLDKAQQTDLAMLASFTRTKSRFEIVESIHEKLFSHVEDVGTDVGGMLRRKACMLGVMLKMALDVEIGRREGTDRDNLQNKRFKTSGVLMFEEFQRNFRENGKEMLLRMDRRHTYEKNLFREKNLVNLVDEMNVGYFWRSYFLLNKFEKAFKGSWGDRLGIAQELMRVSYLSVIHHLRKTDLQIDKSTSTAPPRRYYGSQVGLMCPVDSPDGSDIGYKKSLSIFARVTTAFPAATVKKVLRETGLIREIQDIHPSTWMPEWTKIVVNSDLWAVCIGNTEELHAQLLTARRSGVFAESVSLAWMRINNEYRIACDAGRPIRPVYRPGTTPEVIKAAKTWKDIQAHLDYIDAAESDSLRISLGSFHPTLPSEIHMSFNMSALANMVPYSDHNPATRSVFSIAQQKAAAGWYHTNYMKRFDTIAEFLCLPQKPLSQTWLYHEMMGRGGCLAYGENAIVAITMYGGNNQEDSVLMNAASLKRGMFKTMYYHSYDHTEEGDVIPGKEKTILKRSEIKNPLSDESIKRKEGYNYEMLDADGLIKVGTMVDDKTILLGMVAPILTPTGAVTGYRDVSVEPKRGQIGRVDAVYPYVTDAGFKGVKIRIVEDRTPIIGDKMSSRHSQKGTVGEVMDEQDMPFTASGLRPDLIFNPHGIPTRMTVGQFLEAGSNKLGVHLGSFIDATPFTVENRIPDLKKALLDAGFEPYSHEVLYNGMTGEQMDADIFMGPIFYQRLKQMVEDKINYRDTGPRTMRTHQPTQGRSNEGGMRIGEMERDSLLAHGVSKFIEESFMKRSDGHEFLFDKDRGVIDTSRDTLEMPYAMGVFLQELECMHVVPKLITSGSQ